VQVFCCTSTVNIIIQSMNLPKLSSFLLYIGRILLLLLDELDNSIQKCALWVYNLACRVGGEHGLWGPAERGDVNRVRALIEKVGGQCRLGISGNLVEKKPHVSLLAQVDQPPGFGGWNFATSFTHATHTAAHRTNCQACQLNLLVAPLI
jgi:hypothetical protein